MLQQFVPFISLLRADLRAFRPLMFSLLANTISLVICEILVFKYILPLYGLSHGYASFFVPGLIASSGVFDIYQNAANFLSDFENEQTILQRMSLPISARMLWFEQIAFLTLRILTQSIITFLFLIPAFDATRFSPVRFAIVLLAQALLFATGSLLTTSIMPSFARARNAWRRVIYPLWVAGCFQISWHMMYTHYPVFAYLNLVNPFTYIMEAIRAAMLGQEGSLPFWFTVPCIFGFIIGGTALAIYRLNKRLDVP